MTIRMQLIRTATTNRSERLHLDFSRISKSHPTSKYHPYHRNDLNLYRVSKSTDDFIVNVAKSVDGKTFTLLIKHLNEFRNDVVDNPLHKLTPDSFLIFLDKVKNLTHSAQLNDVILKKITSVNIDELKAKRMLNLYQQHSFDFKFEENLRLGEIKQFAQGVIPKPRFLFDSYKTTESQVTAGEPTEIKKQDDDYFSFFNSHEKVILRPESNFKNVRVTSL